MDERQVMLQAAIYLSGCGIIEADATDEQVRDAMEGFYPTGMGGFHQDVVHATTP